MSTFEISGKITIDSKEYEIALTKLAEKSRETTDEQEKNTDRLKSSTIVAANLITRVVESGVRALENMAKTGIQYNMQIEKYSAALTTALGSEAAAAAAIEKIKDDAARTPYSVDGLVQANQYLISAGESADEARATILALTDAISATGGGNDELSRMALNLQQVKNQGKATAMDLKQFAMAGIDIYGLLADYTGKTIEETKELTVTYDVLNGALQAAAAEGGKYFGANARQAETLNGQLSTLSDNVQAKLGEAFEGVSQKLASDVIPRVNEFVENLDVGEAAENLTDVAIAIGSIAAAVKAPGLIKNVEKLWATLSKPVESGLLTASGAKFGLLGAGIAASAASAKAAVKAYDNTVDSLKDVGETTEDVRKAIEDYSQKLEEMGANSSDFWTTATDEEMRAASAYRQAINELVPELDRLKEAEEAAAEATAASTESTAQVSEELQSLAQTYADVYSKISDSVNGFFGAFEQAPEIVGASIEEMIAALESQTAYNENYAHSMEVISTSGIAGLDGLSESLATSGESGAIYAQAIAEAIEAGDTEKVNELATAWDNVKQSQENLTGVLASTQSAFNNLAEAAGNDVSQITAALDSLNGKTVTIYYNGVLTGTHKHKTGLDYVPYDNYPALLHRGESVLTATEAQARRAGEEKSTRSNTGGGQSVTPIILNVTEKIDGMTLAKNQYKYNLVVSKNHGMSLVNA